MRNTTKRERRVGSFEHVFNTGTSGVLVDFTRHIRGGGGEKGKIWGFLFSLGLDNKFEDA